MSEEDKVREIFEGMRRGQSLGNQLVYDKVLKRLRPSSYCGDSDRAVVVTNQDGHLWVLRKGRES